MRREKKQGNHSGGKTDKQDIKQNLTQITK